VRALLIPVRDDWYAVDLASVREVLEAPRATRVPDAPRSVLGVINVRGSIVAVLDTATLLGLPPLTEARAVVVLARDRGPVGLAALGPALGPSSLSGALDRHRTDVGPAVVLDLPVLLREPGSDA
jgi:hypothetical protein